jgi:hypothetical protein
MAEPLAVYLQDHLAGARFAIELLQDLSRQSGVARLSAELLGEVQADCDVLERLSDQVGTDSSTVKEAAAWVAQKASRFKLQLGEPLGVFEAVEMLSLGVMGKRALWNALRTAGGNDARLSGVNLDKLSSRAEDQFARLEGLRLELARALFVSSRDEPPSLRE